MKSQYHVLAKLIKAHISVGIAIYMGLKSNLCYTFIFYVIQCYIQNFVYT